MTSSQTPRLPQSSDAQTRKQVTDVLHGILSEHMRLAAAKPRSSAFQATSTQRNASLMQALTRAQRNM